MNANLDPRFAVTPDDIRRSGWEAELLKADIKERLGYYGVLFAKAAELLAAGKEVEAQVFGLFGTVAVLSADYSKRQPYEWEMTRADGPRINQADIVTMQSVLHEIQDPEMRAKAADVVWEMGCGTRKLELAQLAVEAFLDSAFRLESGDKWVPFVERVERALQLASKAKRRGELEARVIKIIGERIANYALDPSSGLLCSRLMDLLLAYGSGDPAHYAAVSTQLAEANEVGGDMRFAHNYWQRATQWHRMGKNEPGAREAMRRGAEAYVLLGEENLKGSTPNAGFAAHWIGVGRAELKRVGAPASRLEELHRRILELQAEHIKTARSIDLPEGLIRATDDAVSRVQLIARAIVSGLDLAYALYRLALEFPVTDVIALRKDIEDSTGKFVFPSLLGQTVVSADGRTMGSAPPLTTGSEDTREATLEKNMWMQAKEIHWRLHVVARIDPARGQIVDEHRPTLFDLGFLVFNNPAVPPGRERLFARGLLAGFQRDWVVALHILIPQLENALRHVLTEHGIITSAIKADGTQPELSLDWLLTRSKIKELIGEDMAFDLRGLLTAKFGCNFRNDIAHGLEEEGGFEEPYAQYIWWLVLRWLFMPTLWLGAPADAPSKPR